MGRFRLRKAVAAADSATVRINVVGGLPQSIGPQTTMEYTTDSGRRVRVSGGLPDVLCGEIGAARQIWTGSADHGSTNYQPWMDDLPMINNVEPHPVDYANGEYLINPAWHEWMLKNNPEYAAEAAAEAYKQASEGE